ncbi:hypothetical protein IAD21_00675 [Abditibacteriota bacterium]|nr:hypothetical protein IAD21_00675 [Abditibacteriota bacterium]
MQIRTKDKRLISLVPNAVQSQYLDAICPDWRNGDLNLQGAREIILKSRQFGFSTLILALLFLDTINTPHTQTVVVAHDMDSTLRLFQMVQRFYAHLPAPKPRARYANRREFFWPELDSSFFVGTAGNGEFGRGATISNVLASEVAYWPDGEEIMAALLQAVPTNGNVFQESTANGVGNYFFTEYERARTGQSTFSNHFFPWFAHPEYAVPLSNAEIGNRNAEKAEARVSGAPWLLASDLWPLSQDELQLRTLYNLSDEQLLWRRLKMREPGMRHKFVQEFPTNEREAFLSSGAPYFDLEKLDALALELRDAAFDPLPLEVPTCFPNLRRHCAALQVWASPRQSHAYVIGADTAEGISTYGDHDFDSASVWDTASGEQVAHLHGHFDTHLYGLMLAELGFWFNTALLCIERNNHGHAVINAVLHGAHYPEATNDTSTGLYLHQEYDEKREPRERRPGFPTTSSSKYLILDELASAIENDDFHPRSRALIADLMRFVHLPGGKAGGEAGVHDDRVIDAALARRMLNLRPRTATPFFFNVR